MKLEIKTIMANSRDKKSDVEEGQHTPTAGKFQAYCDFGGLPICGHIGTWYGEERNTRSEAVRDRDDHKRKCPHHEPQVIDW